MDCEDKLNKVILEIENIRALQKRAKEIAEMLVGRMLDDDIDKHFISSLKSLTIALKQLEIEAIELKKEIENARHGK